MDFLPEAFSLLNNFSQFIIYQIVPSKNRPGKKDKMPVDYRTGKIINKGVGNSYWGTFDIVQPIAHGLGENYGIGFVLTEHDPFFFLDIDNCLEEKGWSARAIELAQVFNGAAIEISSSGKGLHIIGKGIAPPHTCNPPEHNLEFYTSGRFIALTGTGALGSVAFDCTDKLPWLIQTYFTPKNESNVKSAWTDSPHAEWRGPFDDQELLNRALNSSSSRAVFGTTASFRDLWECNFEVLERVYNGNQSSYDAALAQHLVYWTGGDCERMLRLMLQSKLVREKWNREDYLRLTITSACAKATAYLQDKPPPVLKSEIIYQAGIVAGNTYLTPEHQTELFKGCIYVRDEHKVLVPGGDLLKPEQFRATYGGFNFIMDANNERTSRNAWEAFSESQANRKVVADSTCFKPALPPGEIVESEGRRLANLWWPPQIKKVPGDVTLFTNHLIKLIPNERDQQILLSWMAACVQYAGIKFQWAPFIQGVEGNGKTLFSECVAYAVGRRYSHFPKSDQIDEKYNAWLYKTLFIGVDDIRITDARSEIMEVLKPMITREDYEIRAMHTGQLMRNICCNFIFNSNHKDGLHKTKNDRRFAPFFTPQQENEDLQKYGLTGDYFTTIYEWLQAREGYAVVAHYLSNYKIPHEFNPANKKPAPLTSSTDAAIAAGLGGIEQEILEAIAQGYPGFCGGWISSTSLDRLLDKLNMNRRIPHNKRRDLLKALGYDWHPHLTDGRVNNIVLPDGAKPRLYILQSHPALAVTNSAEIAKLYSDAQQPK